MKVLLVVIWIIFSLQCWGHHDLSKVDYVSGEFIIKYKQHKYIEPVAYASSSEEFKVLENVKLVHFDLPLDAQKIYEDLLRHPDVEYVEPNYQFNIRTGYEIEKNNEIWNEVIDALLPDDTDFNKTWGMHNSGQLDGSLIDADIDAPEAWAVKHDSPDVVVAIVDSGIDYTHPDLKNNIWINTDEIPGNGIDDDNNGFIDDVRGWNFVNKNNDPMDDHFHGTHCAGTIGAKGNNSLGVAGVTWNVKLMPIKFVDRRGAASYRRSIWSIEYAINNGAHIINSSWGGSYRSPVMKELIDKAQEKGVLIVVAAGNTKCDNDVEPFYPAAFDNNNILTVAASDYYDHLHYRSCFGKKTVDIAAPGRSIYSTVPENRGLYKILSGTSMAAPHVTGVAALLKSQHPDWNYKKIKERILTTVDKTYSLKSRVVSEGRVNAFNAITNKVPMSPWSDIQPGDWKEYEIDIASPHDYPSDSMLEYKLTHPGAKYLMIHFSQIHTERGYDYITVFDKNSTPVEKRSGKYEGFWTGLVQGDELRITLETNTYYEYFGFAIDKYRAIE